VSASVTAVGPASRWAAVAAVLLLALRFMVTMALALPRMLRDHLAEVQALRRRCDDLRGRVGAVEADGAAALQQAERESAAAVLRAAELERGLVAVEKRVSRRSRGRVHACVCPRPWDCVACAASRAAGEGSRGAGDSSRHDACAGAWRQQRHSQLCPLQRLALRDVLGGSV
jgi:hypothetical protein